MDADDNGFGEIFSAKDGSTAAVGFRLLFRNQTMNDIGPNSSLSIFDRFVD